MSEKPTDSALKLAEKLLNDRSAKRIFSNAIGIADVTSAQYLYIADFISQHESETVRELIDLVRYVRAHLGWDKTAEEIDCEIERVIQKHSRKE